MGCSLWEFDSLGKISNAKPMVTLTQDAEDYGISFNRLDEVVGL
jgi:hypothetical protein